MLIPVSVMQCMPVAVVNVVEMVPMLDDCVTTAGTVFVAVVFVNCVDQFAFIPVIFMGVMDVAIMKVVDVPTPRC